LIVNSVQNHAFVLFEPDFQFNKLVIVSLSTF